MKLFNWFKRKKKNPYVKINYRGGMSVDPRIMLLPENQEFLKKLSEIEPTKFKYKN